MFTVAVVATVPAKEDSTALVRNASLCLTERAAMLMRCNRSHPVFRVQRARWKNYP